VTREKEGKGSGGGGWRAHSQGKRIHIVTLWLALKEKRTGYGINADCVVPR
jgi:hypothetical protein